MSAATRNRVLLLSYYFPPLGGSGVQRTVKYVKYLPVEGFEPIVVSGQPRWLHLVRDDRLSNDVPAGTRVIRARTLPLDQLQGKLDALLRRAGLPIRVVKKMLWPDELAGWIPAAVWHGLAAIRRGRIDVLYSTSAPATAHAVALALHRLTGIPWVADFRDAWTHEHGPETSAYLPPTRARAALERRVTAEASYVTVACDSIELVGLARQDPRRVVIPNGVDPDDLERVRVRRPMPGDAGLAGPEGRFVLSYVGSFYGEHDGRAVWAALRTLIARGRIDPSRFEVRIVGNANIDPSQLDSLPVRFTQYVDHEQALAEMRDATALLFTLPAGYRGASGKVYEYLASGRPILCVADPSNVGYRLVEELQAGEWADVSDPAAVTVALERLLARWAEGRLTISHRVCEEALSRFSRPLLARQLAATLRAAVGEATPRVETMPAPALEMART